MSSLAGGELDWEGVPLSLPPHPSKWTVWGLWRTGSTALTFLFLMCLA